MSRAPSRIHPDFTGLFQHAGRVMASRLAAELEGIGLTPRGYCVLFHAMGEERTQAELAELSDADKTTMVVTVDALEKAGLAERKPSPTDRRARIIVPTEEGRRKAEQGAAIVDRVHGAVLEALPEDEREVFVRALERLVGGYLARPVDSARPVRRLREPVG